MLEFPKASFLVLHFSYFNDLPDNICDIDVKMNGSVLFLRKNNFLRCLGWIFFLNCIGDLTSSLLLELLPSKLEPWFVLWSFFLLRLLCIFLKLPYAHVYNLVAMSGLVPLFATWNCWTRYKIRYTGLSVLHLLPLLNSWFIIKM